jgi:predicted membrane-bound dolichyl-phosphate-mannose-protein mannosyltransferase
MKRTETGIGIEKLLIIAVMALAAIFRFTGVNWDQSAHLHPDERFLTMVATNTTWPHTVAEYFNTHVSPLNPHNRDFSFFVYGTYPVHLVKLIATLTGQATYDGIAIVGRLVSASVDLITLFFVFLIAYHLTKNTWAGLLAGFCYAVSVLPLQLSHFFTVDPYVTLFITIALYRLVRHRVDLVTGIAVGFAVSAKISAALILPLCLITLLSSYRWDSEMKKQLPRLFLQGGGFLLGFMTTVRVAYPYLFTGWTINQKVINNWKQLASFDGPTTGFPPGIQWIGVSPWQVPFDLIVWGLGIPLGMITVAAFFFFIFRIFSGNNRTTISIIIAWVALVITYQSLQFAKPMRYVWAAYPALSVLSGVFLYHIGKKLTTRFRPTAVASAIGWLSIGILLSFWPTAFLSVYTTTHPRIAANIWIYTTIRPESSIAWEHWDDPLPFPMRELSPSRYQQIQFPSFDPDDPEKMPKIADVLSRSDYLILSSNRSYGAIHRAKHRFPQTSRYYEKLFAEKLGYTVTKQFTSRPTIPLPITPVCLSVPFFTYGIVAREQSDCDTHGLTVIDDYADETFTVYDHPKVIILKNDRHFSYNELLTLLYE